jgi:hypothetical protein
MKREGITKSPIRSEGSGTCEGLGTSRDLGKDDMFELKDDSDNIFETGGGSSEISTDFPKPVKLEGYKTVIP